MLDEESESILEPLRDFEILKSTIEKSCSSLVTSKAAAEFHVFYSEIVSESLSLPSHSAESLCRVVGRIQQTGVYPTEWKQATVLPTLGKGSKSDVENYRSGGPLDRMVLRKYAVYHWDRSEMVKENEIETMFSNN